MGKILIHPVHRRYIKFLRDQVKKGNPILLTQSDLDRFKNLINRTNLQVKRHKGFYRLTLQAINRSKEEAHELGVTGVIGHHEIDIIERTLAKVERRGLYKTLMGTVIWYCRKRKFISALD